MVKNKIRWVVGLLVVFFLILGTNLTDQKHFRTVKESISTIYYDRLVAKDLVYELTLLLQEKKLAVLTADSAFYTQRNQFVNRSINDLIERFYDTKLTYNEKNTLDDFNNQLSELLEYEGTYIKNNLANADPLKAMIEELNDDLYTLSKIQVDEGKLQFSIGEKSVNIIELFTQIEIGLLIVIGVLIQIIIIYKPKVV